MTFQHRPTKSQRFTISVSGALILVDWHATGDLAALQELERIEDQVCAQSGGRFCILQYVSGPMDRLGDDVKQKAAELTKKFEGKMIGSAIVLPGTGLGAMMLRTIVTGINALSRSSTPSKCYGTIGEALAWLQGLPGQHEAVKRLDTRAFEAVLKPPVAKAA